MKKLPISTVIVLLTLGCARLLAARLLVLDASAGTSTNFVKNRAGSESVLMFTRTSLYSAQAWLQGGERFPKGGLIVVKSGNDLRSLVPTFAAAIDPSLNSEGTSVLFAGKERPENPAWQILVKCF